MKLKIKRLEDRSILPTYATPGSAGFDLHSIDDISIPAGTTAKIRTGIAIEVPEGYELQIRPRSGMSANTKVRVANSPGTIDSDYRLEIVVILDNICQNQADSYRVKQGDRIAQAVLKKVERATFDIVDTLSGTSRTGGLGSTGV
jgi:dUTP pyrophosphatase